ncbi:unnamed protein product [Rotaria sordida]|uniref:Transient receptor potential cation channel subfamily A member 1 n=1 Tax=Rotaria sordida TaxID=392033 RepID=A0A814MLB1_9BILA|nr:unnamed protein product [Rotaria sordida]CAF3605110.1 unnamed protein product [Rotaria sordida]
MTAVNEFISANNVRLFELLLKATRTSNESEAIQWWKHFNENLDPYQTRIKRSLNKKNYFSLLNKQNDLIVQVLAQQLDKDKLSILHYVAYYNNLFICCKLVDLNCDFNIVGKNGETILHIAARSKAIDEDTHRVNITNNSENQQQSLLIYLLSKTNNKQKPLVDINKRDNQGRTALHHAVMSNRIANVKVLLDYEASIIIKDIHQATPLHYACRFNRTNDIVRYLLLRADSFKFQSTKFKWIRQSISHKTSYPIYSKIDYINANTTDGHDAFSLARAYNHEEILEELFKHIPHDDFRWQEKDKIICDQIYEAILTEDLSLIDSYPAWLVINESTGETPLHIACTRGCPKAVLHLLNRQYLDDDHSSNIIFLREKQNGFTPILSAAYAGQAECFEQMLNIILKLITTNKYSITLINDILIDRYGRTLLHICVLSRQFNILEILMLSIQSNPFLFVQIIEPMIFTLDYNDETPLHLAVRLNLYSICQLLLLFADKLDEIQQPCIYLDKVDGELIRSIVIYTEDIQLVPSYMLSMLTKSHVFIIGYKNKNGQSSFHMAILYGYKHIMDLFLKHVNTYAMNYLLEHTDATIRTPLHLAAFYGHSHIIQELLVLNVNIYVRDNHESTPLHCVARCVGIKCYDGIDASVCILDMFLKYIENYRKNSFDFLTTIDGLGHNCLETATISRNRPFVEYLLNLNNISLFKNLLRNAQLLDIHNKHIDTPLRKLITYMPDLAYRVLDIFITHIGNKHEAQHKIIYDFEFLEDHCYIQQWQQRNMASQIIKKKSINKCYCPIFCRHKPVEFQNQFFDDNHCRSLFAYTTNPYTLVHNNVLSVMCKCAKEIDLKDHEDESKDVQYSYKLMHHPLCSQLTQLKWKQFGLPLFLIFFSIYCLYLILFTIQMLRNRQPEYFYRLVNASFPNAFYSHGPALNCEEVGERLAQLNIQEALKQPADRIIKTLVIVLLWIHVIKDALLIIGVHRFSLVWRIYMETVTLILSFICLYDDNPWQGRLRFRCPTQWQLGAFGVFLAWTTLLSYLRFFPIFGVYVVMLEVIMLKFLWFAPVLIILICSYSTAFYMLLQNQPVFSTIPFAWFRSAFMVLDTGYEDRFFGPDSEAYISLYPVLFVLFLFFGVTMTILVNNLLIALAVGEIADLSAIARVRNLTRRYELLREWEIFRLQFLWSPAPLQLRHEHFEKKWNRQLQTCLRWVYRYTFLKTYD